MLLDDIAVIAAEGDEWCLGGPRNYIKLCSAFQKNYTTIISSTEIRACKLNREKQKLKINSASHLLRRSRECVQETPIRQFRRAPFFDQDVMIPDKKYIPAVLDLLIQLLW